MAVSNGMFLFEVVVESVQSMVESRCLVIKSDFADIFSLELKDPKQMHIVMPEPLPLPPEPVGKKGKKKPKPKKPKKGKKGKEPPPPPEPVIQSGQSVLFSSNAEFLIQNMKKCALEVSLWSKEERLVFIGSGSIPWDPVFITYLSKIADNETPVPVTLRDDYNIFEEGTAKLMAKLGMQVKLSYLGEKVCTAFRTLSEDPTIRKYLYTGINSKQTSYICTLKTTDEDFEKHCNKIENSFIVDKQAPVVGKIHYADYKNAPGANLTFFNDGDYCCMGSPDKPPESIYKSPETCPDVDFIIDYVRKIIVSCNDNMRMLTPRPTITPKVKATDIDRLCYCRETAWPESELAQRFKKETQAGPCPMCIGAGKKSDGSRATTFDIANIRGPCGRPDCRIARDLRAYIENLVEEDNKEFDLNEMIGPCGSKSCTLAEKIQEFLRHEGVFSKGATLEGLSTQCACLQTMQNALEKKSSCDSNCSKNCQDSESDVSTCGGKVCPYSKPHVYNVYYFTVEHDFDKDSSGTPSSKTVTDKPSIYKYCATDCPTLTASEKGFCSKSVCSTVTSKKTSDSEDSKSKCQTPVCPSRDGQYPSSPADSDIVIQFKDILKPCCVKTCDVADTVKDFIADSLTSRKIVAAQDQDDPCYCDCECSFKFNRNTTYCAICGGYECLGDDMKSQPDHIKPHPCPIYHKLYDKHYIKTPNPWPDEEKKQQQPDSASVKSSKGARTGSKTRQSADKKSSGNNNKNEKKQEDKAKKVKPEKKKVGKFTANVEEPKEARLEKRPETKYPYPSVPRNMGWSWNAEDIPGLKPRPNWKPGAANKLLVRRYRAMREGMDVIAKKKRAMMQRKKKIESKPTLIVTKRDGEYTVQMEVFKKYSKERLLFQYPYDEKPPLIYTIGKTEQEKMKIQKQRDRRIRRDTRRKSRLLQSTFRDKCQEICLKAYNQAIGLLPLPKVNDPDCPCYTDTGYIPPPQVDSCSCSDEGTISTSDTDNDEWTIEFSPPAAKYDGKAKHPPVLTDNETQYTYLDYKVKLLDKSGNQVPRFFKNLEGKQECSDLGGFWSPEHVWLEINKDGYIGPDNRWVPMNFIGPDGMFYSAEEGSFTDNTGQLLKIGVDGYINRDSKWVWYSKQRRTGAKSTATSTVTMNTDKTGKSESNTKYKGDAKSKEPDTAPAKRKPDKKAPSRSAKIDNKADKAKTVTTAVKTKNPTVMDASFNYYERNKLPRPTNAIRLRTDIKKIAKYNEIMKQLQMYEDFYDLRPLVKTNRATQNILRKRQSTFAMHRSLAPIRSIISKNRSSNCSNIPSVPSLLPESPRSCYERNDI